VPATGSKSTLVIARPKISWNISKRSRSGSSSVEKRSMPRLPGAPTMQAHILVIETRSAD
jgi:hypothetical protein